MELNALMATSKDQPLALKTFIQCMHMQTYTVEVAVVDGVVVAVTEVVAAAAAGANVRLTPPLELAGADDDVLNSPVPRPPALLPRTPAPVPRPPTVMPRPPVLLPKPPAVPRPPVAPNPVLKPTTVVLRPPGVLPNTPAVPRPPAEVARPPAVVPRPPAGIPKPLAVPRPPTVVAVPRPLAAAVPTAVAAGASNDVSTDNVAGVVVVAAVHRIHNRHKLYTDHQADISYSISHHLHCLRFLI